MQASIPRCSLASYVAEHLFRRMSGAVMTYRSHTSGLARQRAYEPSHNSTLTDRQWQ